MVVVIGKDRIRFNSQRLTMYQVDYTGSNETATNSDHGGCLDFKLQRTVPLGDWYQSEDCEICLCSNERKVCQQVCQLQSSIAYYSVHVDTHRFLVLPLFIAMATDTKTQDTVVMCAFQ